MSLSTARRTPCISRFPRHSLIEVPRCRDYGYGGFRLEQRSGGIGEDFVMMGFFFTTWKDAMNPTRGSLWGIATFVFSHSYPALHCELDDGSLAFLRKESLLLQRFFSSSLPSFMFHFYKAYRLFLLRKEGQENALMVKIRSRKAGSFCLVRHSFLFFHLLFYMPPGPSKYPKIRRQYIFLEIPPRYVLYFWKLLHGRRYLSIYLTFSFHRSRVLFFNCDLSMFTLERYIPSQLYRIGTC